MPNRFIPRHSVMSEFKNYLMITLGLTLYAFTWKFFMAPYKFVTGGITGVGGIVEYTIGIPMQYTYFAINIILIIIAIQQLGWKFCVKTIYAIVVMTIMLELFDIVFQTYPTAYEILGPDKQLEACIVGSIFIGMGIAFCFLSNGSTGGVDIIHRVGRCHAVMLHKRRCDGIVIVKSRVRCSVRQDFGAILEQPITRFPIDRQRAVRVGEL